MKVVINLFEIYSVNCSGSHKFQSGVENFNFNFIRNKLFKSQLKANPLDNYRKWKKINILNNYICKWINSTILKKLPLE